MRKEKRFDCVQMKWDIQQKIQKEFSNVSDEEANKIQMKRIWNSPILGSFLKKVRLAKNKAA